MVGESDPSGYILKFISGKYQGGEFQLDKNAELILGRSSELEMVLVEDMVSRHHAIITTTEDEIWIADNGSTNGTFVNGEKISKVKLKEGDRILVGTSIIKLVYEEMTSLNNDSNADFFRGNAHAAQGRTVPPSHTIVGGGDSAVSPPQKRVLEGVLEMVPLPDLLQLFGSSRRSGCLVIQAPSAEGKIYLRDGRVYGATIDDHVASDMEKPFYRMMAWNQGTFRLDPDLNREFEAPLNHAVESLMMEGMRILDEIRNIGPDVPDMNAHLHLPIPLIPPLRNLTPELLDTLQLVHNYGRIETVLDKSLATDLETLQDVVYLMRNHYLSEED